MKNPFSMPLIACLLICFCFQSCTESSVKPDSVNMQLVKEVENLSQDLVWIGYNKLNSSEKVTLWNRHLDTYLNNPKVSFDLKNHILELKTIITEEGYEKVGTEENEKFMDAFTEKWFHEPVRQGRFSRETLFEIGTLFGFGTGANAKGAKVSIASLPGATLACKCYWSMSCPTSKYCTDKNNCTGSNCGITGRSRCSGVCE